MNWEYFVALAAVIAGLRQQLGEVVGWFRGLVFRRVRMSGGTASMVLRLLEGDKGASEPAYAYSSDYFVHPLGRRARIVYERRNKSGSRLVWCGRAPAWFSTSDKDAGFESSFTFVRGTINWDALLVRSAEFEDSFERESGRFKVVYHHGRTLGGEIAEQKKREADDSKSIVWGADSDRLLKWKPEDIGGRKHDTTIDDLALMPEIADVVREARQWHTSKNWYAERRLPWRRGFLFHGAPGTGKTTLARELAADMNVPIHVLDLASMSNEDLRGAWEEATSDAPCMVLLEDIDGVFQGRTNVATGGGMMSSGGLTFDCLLNCVDGVERADGVCLVITTNVPEAVDEALKRPGRVDRSVEFMALDFVRRLKLAEGILGVGAASTQIAHDTDGKSAAAVTEACCRVAVAERFAEGAYR